MADKNSIKFYKSKSYADAIGASKVANAVYFTNGTGDTSPHAIVVNGKAYGYGDIMTSNTLGVAKLGYTSSGSNFAVSADTAGALYTAVPAATSDAAGIVQLGSVAKDDSGVVTGGAVYEYVSTATNNALVSATLGFGTYGSDQFTDDTKVHLNPDINIKTTDVSGAVATSRIHLSPTYGIFFGSQNAQTSSYNQYLYAMAAIAGIAKPATGKEDYGTTENGYIHLLTDQNYKSYIKTFVYHTLTDGVTEKTATSYVFGLDDDLLTSATDTTTYTNTNIALASYVDEQVASAIAGGVHYKGVAESTTAPTNPSNGDMYKVTVDGAFGVKDAKIGDVLIYKVSGKTGAWDLIPSGDDIEYDGVNVGTTTVIDPTKGGTVDFKVGDGLTVTGAAGSVTYSHATPSGAAATGSGFYKIATDGFGHVTGTTAVAKSDITTVLGDYVTAFGGASGAITLATAPTTGPAAKLTMTGSTLGVELVGVGSAATHNATDFATADALSALETKVDGKQDKITDGSATIASKNTTTDEVTIKAGVTQSNGTIANSTDADIVLKKIASTGAASDVSVTTITGLTGDNVQTVLTNLPFYIKTTADTEAAAKIDDLEAASFNLASVSGKTLTINAIKEVDGIISADTASSITFTDTNDNQTIKVGTTTFGANEAVEITGEGGVSVTAATSKITVKHSNSITAGSVGDAAKIPVITYDANGHITKAETVDVVSAADGKLKVGETTIFSANASADSTISAEGAVQLTATANSLTIGCYWED